MVLLMIYRNLSFAFLVVILLFSALYAIGAGVHLTIGDHTVLLGFNPHGNVKIWSGAGEARGLNHENENRGAATSVAPEGKPQAVADALGGRELGSELTKFTRSPKKAASIKLPKKASKTKRASKRNAAPKIRTVSAPNPAPYPTFAPMERHVAPPEPVHIQRQVIHARPVVHIYNPPPQPRVIYVQRHIPRPVHVHVHRHAPTVWHSHRHVSPPPRHVHIHAHVSHSRHAHHGGHRHVHASHHRHAHGHSHRHWRHR
jgi:hypothetical protein